MNTVTTRFNSYFYEPGCTGTDAFAQLDWDKGLNFVNPPLSLMARVVYFLRELGPNAKTLVIAPHWTS